MIIMKNSLEKIQFLYAINMLLKKAFYKAMFALSVETDPKQHSIKIQQKSLGVAL